jgi:hypothetical protein
MFHIDLHERDVPFEQPQSTLKSSDCQNNKGLHDAPQNPTNDQTAD